MIRRGALPLALMAAAITSCAQAHPPRESSVPRDALDRKARSDAVMRREGVPVNATLPVIESETEVKAPTTEEIAMRAVAALAVAAKAMKADKAAADLVTNYQLARWLSPAEARFMADPVPTEKERLANGWRLEAANVLFWSIGYVDRLGPPRSQCDPAALMALVAKKTRAELLAGARLRPLAAILDEADLIYRYRWALVDAQINGRPAPAGLNDDVAMERHQALNWLVQHADTAWDDISLDT